MARVSNPDGQGQPGDRLIRYLLRNKHWSPFEMVSACVEITTTRDVSRQILRHRSFSFQEFSGRYAKYSGIGNPETLRASRLQDSENRQNSLPDTDEARVAWWAEMQKAVADHCAYVYDDALSRGIAKEVARAVLPEGLTPTTMYMTGTLRSWIHYWDLRCHEATQLEHRLVARETMNLVLPRFANVMDALKLNDIA